MTADTGRIRTTHTGSLPRPRDLVTMLQEREAGAQPAGFDARVRAAVLEAVKRQAATGLSIVNDGEQGRADYTVYVKDRLTGFDGESTPLPNLDAEEFPEWTEMARQLAPPFQQRPACTGPIEWKDWPAVERDIQNLRDATAGTAGEVFMTSPSPGQIGRFLQNRHYPSDEAYLYRLAEIMRREYRAIVQAGFLLQIDCPDLALGRSTQFANLTLAEFRRVAEMHVEVLNHAVADLPAERMRMHICWASTGGPHHRDVPLADIVDIVVKGRPAGLMFPGANPRHGHEWKVWKGVRLPPDKVLIPGVIDSTTNFIEHPELVAERIERYAAIVGRERVVAGCDCGFGTFAGRVQVDTNIVWRKLASLVEGAALASTALR
ncbi:MAG TPA: cobalamin-independent methionine synthase II family protein [Methylomirabilota bacterium]|jgi:5-methyltetrahydropteroyltriglutamate--homocysteine methyltransferase|nr:cobalamin-independent methionine synthase II family protein [Methylomirabilota bacterium]